MIHSDLAYSWALPENLEMIFKYLHGQTTSEEMWFCLVRQSVFEEMENRRSVIFCTSSCTSDVTLVFHLLMVFTYFRAAIDSGSADRQRLSRLLEILVKYQDLGVVQTISIAESPSHCLSPPEFLPICVKEQMKRVHQCRHVIFITGQWLSLALFLISFLIFTFNFTHTLCFQIWWLITCLSKILTPTESMSSQLGNIFSSLFKLMVKNLMEHSLLVSALLSNNNYYCVVI